MAGVKTSSRAERARATRRRMLRSARELFVTQGYAATTMDRIAANAAVAVQTVYYTFGTKGALLCELMEVTAAGHDEPEPVERRPWMREVMTTTSAQRALALAIEHGTAIFERAAPLWPAINAAAAADPAVGEYWTGVAANRRAGQRAFVARLSELGALQPGLDITRGTDIVVVLFGHDVFRGLVEEAGWTIPAYKAWLFSTLVAQLLGRKPDSRALRGLSYAQSTA